MSDTDPNITRLLDAAACGDREVNGQLMSAIYGELRALAAHMMAKEPAGHTLQATALVHEAFVKIVGAERVPTFEDRRHFFNAAANVMRHILVDRHRRAMSEKHGGGRSHDLIDDLEMPAARELAPEEIPFLDEALEELRGQNNRWSEIIHLRYFMGLTIEQTADVLGISPATVKSDWQFARALLKVKLMDQCGEV